VSMVVPRRSRASVRHASSLALAGAVALASLGAHAQSAPPPGPPLPAAPAAPPPVYPAAPPPGYAPHGQAPYGYAPYGYAPQQPVYVIEQVPDEDPIEKKRRKRSRRTKVAGMALFFSGLGVGAIGGTIMAITAPERGYRSTGSALAEVGFLSGAVFLGIGAACVLTGIPLWAIGSSPP
jgi:hypothetical protein